MKLLLDTQLLVWAAARPAKLSAKARRLIENPRNDLLYSAATIWEVTIKNTLGRQDFRIEPGVFRRALLDNGYGELPVTGEHAVAVAGLPDIHKDPFDRLLVAQAASEGITLLTTDAIVARYPGPVTRV